MSTISSRLGTLSEVAPQGCLVDALHLLARAHGYAFDAHADTWQFAVQMGELRRLGVFKCDVRWLLVQGYVTHAEEIPPAGDRRRFRDSSRANVLDNSCFVITPAGLDAIHAKRVADLSPWRKCRGDVGANGDAHCVVARLHDAPPGEPLTPIWNPTLSELTMEGRLVKRFRRPAPNQQLILQEFQAAAWPERIRDPLPGSPDICPKRRLHETIRALNRNQDQPLVRFCGDGSARGVLWTSAS